MKTALKLTSLCVPRVATTPGALGLAITRYAGNQLLGTSPAPRFLREIEQDGVIKIHPFAENDKGVQTLDLCPPEGAAFREADFGARRDMLLEQYTESQLTYSHNLIDAYENGSLPRVVAVTVNPDELDAYAKEIIGLWERFIDDDVLTLETTPKQITENFPGFAATCNGIVVDQFETALNQEIEASTKITVLLNELGPKGPVIKKSLMETIFRIGPLQAAARTDQDGSPVYLPRKLGSLELAGGTRWLRNTARYLIDRNFDAYRRSEQDIYHIDYVSRLLIEARAADYVKAMFTININALAIVLSLRESGEFKPVTMGDMANTPEYAARVRAYAEAMFDIAYIAGYMTTDGLNFEDEFATMISVLRHNAAHPTSSVVMVQQLMQAGKLSPNLGPNEVAIFDPAIAEAERQGLNYYVELLTGLKSELMQTLEKLAAGQ